MPNLAPHVTLAIPPFVPSRRLPFSLGGRSMERARRASEPGPAAGTTSGDAITSAVGLPGLLMSANQAPW